MDPPWEFEATGPVYGYYKLIADEMVRQFDISFSEAVGRINNRLRGNDLRPLKDHEDDIIYHETPSHWARLYYFEDGSYWWILEEDKRERLGLGPIKPARFP